jgi:hypothetical protein
MQPHAPLSAMTHCTQHTAITTTQKRRVFSQCAWRAVRDRSARCRRDHSHRLGLRDVPCVHTHSLSSQHTYCAHARHRRALPRLCAQARQRSQLALQARCASRRLCASSRAYTSMRTVCEETRRRCRRHQQTAVAVLCVHAHTRSHAHTHTAHAYRCAQVTAHGAADQVSGCDRWVATTEIRRAPCVSSRTAIRCSNFETRHHGD